MNLKLHEHDLHFLIGPNGAGKTTMLDVICGKTKPLSGTVRLEDGTELTRLKEHQIVRKGVGRKFQAPSIFERPYRTEKFGLGGGKSAFTSSDPWYSAVWENQHGDGTGHSAN